MFSFFFVVNKEPKNHVTHLFIWQDDGVIYYDVASDKNDYYIILALVLSREYMFYLYFKHPLPPEEAFIEISFQIYFNGSIDINVEDDILVAD